MRLHSLSKESINAAKKLGIELVNNTYVGGVITLVKPELTGESLIELEENCWF